MIPSLRPLLGKDIKSFLPLLGVPSFPNPSSLLLIPLERDSFGEPSDHCGHPLGCPPIASCLGGQRGHWDGALDASWDGAGMEPRMELFLYPSAIRTGLSTTLSSVGELGGLGMDLSGKSLGIKSFLLLNRIFSPNSRGCSCPNTSQFFSSTFPFSWTHLENPFVFLFPHSA